MPNKRHPKQAEEQLKRAFDKLSSKYPGRTGRQARVYTQGLGQGYQYVAAGVEKPYQVASVGKLFTAVLVFMLVEEGAICLEDTICTYLPPDMLKQLFVYHGVDYAQQVTVRHLLGHTSGCADYFEDKVHTELTLVEEIISQPNKVWTPDMTIDFTRQCQSALGKPGVVFHYTDTGYNLLGKIVEAVTYKPFHQYMHERLFTPLRMDDSYLMFRSQPKNAPAPVIDAIWLAGHEVSKTLALSCNWAGGGVVSTLSDLLKFSIALCDEKLIGNATLKLMQKPENKYRQGIYYGLGMMSVDFGKLFFLLKGLPTITGHTGVFTTHLYFDPVSKTHVIMNMGNDKAMHHSFNAPIQIGWMIAKMG